MAGFVSYSFGNGFKAGEITSGVRRGGVRGINRALEFLKSVSVPLAPLDVGTLRGSAAIDVATEARPIGALVFDTPYAARQHEELDYHHDDGQAKYVEEPMHEHKDLMMKIVAKEVAVGIAQQL